MKVRSYVATAFALASLCACLQLPTIVITPIPPANATPAAPPVVEPPAVVEPPVVEPPAAPAPEPRDLEILVRDGAQRPILTAAATNHDTGEVRRVSDGDGRIHFAVTGSVLVEVVAPGYTPERRDVPPGTHIFNLTGDGPTPPVGAPEPPKPAPSACTAVPGPPAHRLDCIRELKAASLSWFRCESGEGVYCHRFVREVATKFNELDSSTRWGLVSKGPGEQQCSFTACGRNLSGGFAEDVIAFKPGEALNDWIGFDIIRGAGEPNADVVWNGPLERRPGNLWAAVPKP